MPRAREIKKTLSILNIDQFIGFLNKLQFIDDDPNVEQLRAPWIVLDLGGGDCDDIALFSAFWAKVHQKPFCWVMWGDPETNNIQHISTVIKVNGQNINVDWHNNPDWGPMHVDGWRK